MDSEALAVVALLGLAAWLATRSNAAGATVLPGGYTYGDGGDFPLPGSDSGAIINFQPGGSSAPWLTPVDDTGDFDTGGTTPDMNTGDPAANMEAMLALIRSVEPGPGQYQAIAGYPGVAFTDFREHPFILDPNRPQPAGTTASGAYQMVRQTWREARDALGLKDFSPASQDAAAFYLIQRRPGAAQAVSDGRFMDAITLLQNEWEAFKRMLARAYPVTLAQAQQIYTDAGGTVT